jgi:hypothetical protein
MLADSFVRKGKLNGNTHSGVFDAFQITFSLSSQLVLGCRSRRRRRDQCAARRSQASASVDARFCQNPRAAVVTPSCARSAVLQDHLRLIARAVAFLLSQLEFSMLLTKKTNRHGRCCQSTKMTRRQRAGKSKSESLVYSSELLQICCWLTLVVGK